MSGSSCKSIGLQVGEIGAKILLLTGFDLTSATSVSVLARRPNRTTVEWAGAVEAPPTDGKLSYVTIAGDLDLAGKWRFQAKVVTSGGAVLFGEAVEVIVKALYEL